MKKIEVKSKETKNKLQEKSYVLGRIIGAVFFVAGVVLGIIGLIIPAAILIGIVALGGAANIITKMVHSKEKSSSQNGLEKGVESEDRKFREKEKEDEKSTEKKLEGEIESKDEGFLLSKGDLELMIEDTEKLSREVSNHEVHSATVKYEIERDDGTIMEIITQVDKVR